MRSLWQPWSGAFALAGALSLLVACRPPHTGPVHLARGATFTLAAPGLGPTFFATQHVGFTFADGREETFLCTVESTPECLSVVTSTPMGQTLFIVQVRPSGTTVERRLPLPRTLDPRLIPALVQLSAWPQEALAPALGKGMSLEDQGPQRTLRKGHQTLLKVRREGSAPPYGRLELELPVHNLRATITTLEAQP